MQCDLEVDTDLITTAIAELRTAIDTLDVATTAPPEIASTAAGHCATGREALTLSHSRMEQARCALSALGAFAEGIEDNLRATVTAFESAEQLCLTGR